MPANCISLSLSYHNVSHMCIFNFHVRFKVKLKYEYMYLIMMTKKQDAKMTDFQNRMQSLKQNQICTTVILIAFRNRW